jgi:hypothetical protein
MQTPRELTSTLIERARAQQDRYAHGADRPLGGYLVTMGSYAGLVGAIALLARATRRDIPRQLGTADVVRCAAATHKLSRLLTKDPVTSPLRAPFASYEGTAGPAELREEVRGQGTRKTVGELVTCPFCASVWIATAFTAGLLYLPRTTRLATATLTALAGADLLQFGHALLEHAAENAFPEAHPQPSNPPQPPDGGSRQPQRPADGSSREMANPGTSRAPGASRQNRPARSADHRY